jgi:hypothetical protein
MSGANVTAAQRTAVAERALFCCEYCLSQLRFSPDPFSVEHVIPQISDGSSDLDNLALACQGCNGRKYTSTEAIDPVSGKTVPLYHPRRDDWSAHFAWRDDYLHILGLTPTGRATVERLALNREGVVNLRRALRSIRAHPPLQEMQEDKE